ncbi:mevalonate kinase [Pontibacter sp. JAM-7]|uniref:mevalonate kinase family protein n=1 Tax=Pontibacter sp. JAM-7 TaxID=3366581 RepID=UPI003AF89A6F
MQTIKLSVPGSIMLLGEHAILFGEQAVACAVDKYIHITLTPRSDRLVQVDSALGQHQTCLEQLAPHASLSFVMAAIRQVQSELPAGFTLKIESEFSHTVGLGSSAAVTAGTVAALHAYAGLSLEPVELFDRALAAVHEVQQGRGSGTDLVASIYGGLVAYRFAPREIVPLAAAPQLGLYYAGYKTPTPEVLRAVEHQSAQCPVLYKQLYRLMGETSQQSIAAIQSAQWAVVGRTMNLYQGLLDALGVNDATLSDMIYRLRGFPEVLGVKISGSGLGDCVVTLGAAPELTGYEQIPIAVSRQGVSIEFI